MNFEENFRKPKLELNTYENFNNYSKQIFDLLEVNPRCRVQAERSD